jgi:predicted HAD superfamily Cof-like phosphohydrolase
MSNKHPALGHENLAKLEGESVWSAQRTLMRASDQSLPEVFQLNNDAILYGALIGEEGGETLEALDAALKLIAPGVVSEALLQKIATLGAVMRKMSKEIRDELAQQPKFAVDVDVTQPAQRNALKQMIDGAADTVVVTAGFTNAAGMDGELSYAAAQQSNHTKIDPATGKMFKGADGKWTKGPYFTEPDWDYVIDQTIERRVPFLPC